MPMLRQMGYSIPRLLGYMSEQAIYMVNSFQFIKISQAYPGLPTVRERSYTHAAFCRTLSNET